jgi:effector-binding domain-containing protein
MKTILSTALFFIWGALLMTAPALAAETAYPNTPNGEIGIKTIPASKLLVAESPGNYFENNNQLFSRLFNYIRSNEVAMTTPVEARIENSQMKFYVGGPDSVKDLRDQGQVKVITMPERKVAAIGIRGAYSKSSFEENRAKLESWLREQPQYEPAGEPYAVYWNSPMVPWFLKHSEVHIPVVEKK